MKIFPAIDLFGGKAVRLRKGDYAAMTVYGEHPEEIAEEFKRLGASCIHIVDLEGAKSGDTPNFDAIKKILAVGGLFSEIGGGIRSMTAVEKYLSAGASRVILGTAALEDEAFLDAAIAKYGEKIAVGADVKDGNIAVRGWLDRSDVTLWDFAKKMQKKGVRALICTDISRDGEMKGANLGMYKRLKSELDIEIIASGGVSSLEEIKVLKESGVGGAIVGKAYYEHLIDLKDAIAAAE